MNLFSFLQASASQLIKVTIHFNILFFKMSDLILRHSDKICRLCNINNKLNGLKMALVADLRGNS